MSQANDEFVFYREDEDLAGRSVVQDWVMRLPLREQGTILTAIRGCDLTPKQPYDAPERELVSYLRWIVLVPADEREVSYAGSFMQRWPPQDWKQSDLGHYPLHFVAHLMHAFEVVGYRHPNAEHQHQAYIIYRKLVHGLHLNLETREQMIERLSEDRIASGNVVS